MPNIIFIIAGIVIFIGCLLFWRGLAGYASGPEGKTAGTLKILIGLIFIIIPTAILTLAAAVSPYGDAIDKKPLGEISFELQATDTFNYVATIKRTGDIGRRYKINGDQWSLDAQFINWTDALQQIGFTDKVQITGLHSNYSVKIKTNDKPKSHRFNSVKLFDVKRFYNEFTGIASHLFSMQQASTTQVPVVNGGTYQLYLKPDGTIFAELVFNQ